MTARKRPPLDGTLSAQMTVGGDGLWHAVITFGRGHKTPERAMRAVKRAIESGKRILQFPEASK